jgi:N utilization substance protein A
LAIGKKGQNVRLAAKLLGWKIDIKSEEEKRQEVEQQMQDLTGGPATPIEQVSELGESVLQKLVAAGITTVEALADMTPEQLEEIPGIGEKTLEKISIAVRHYFGQFETGEDGHVPEGSEAASLKEEPESVLETNEAEVENDAAVLDEVASADDGESLQDQAAESLEEVVQGDEQQLLDNIEAEESATTDEQAAKEGGA